MGELLPDYVVGGFFVEEVFAVLQEIDFGDAGVHEGGPAGLAAPPVTPEVSFGTISFMISLVCRGDGFWFAMILGTAAFAEFILLAGGDSEPDAFAAMGFVIITAICTLADDFAVFDDNGAGRHMLVEGFFVGNFFGGLHIYVIETDVVDFALWM